MRATTHFVKLLAYGGLCVGALALLAIAAGIGVSEYTQSSSESWFLALFRADPHAAAGATTCQRGLLEPAPCNFAELAAFHLGVTDVDCFENAPLSWTAWDCNVSFKDGRAILVLTNIGWSQRWAHAYPDS